MKRTTASLLTGALATGTFAVLATVTPGIASASGCGTTVLNETGKGVAAWDAPGRFSTALGDQRSAGHSVVVDGGLRVYTDDATSQAKAAAQYPVQGTPALADYTAASNYAYEYALASGGGPGYNLVVDINGPADGGYTTLVMENGLYGGKFWANPAADRDKVQGVPGSDGYAHLGTIQQYSDANPDAVILAFGYSLGSGVKGDATITKIRFGCNDFVFDLANRAPVAVIAEPVDEADASYRTFWFDGSRSNDPDGDINLSYTWNFGDGSPTATGAQVNHQFPKGSKTYTVTLTVADPSGLTGTDETVVQVTPPTNTVGAKLANTGADVKGLAALGGLAVAGSAAGLVANRRRKGAGAS